MYNTNEEDIIQIIKYKSLKFNIYNRDLLASSENPLGYKKEITGYPLVEKLDKDKNVINIKEKYNFSLTWDLFLSEERFKELLGIYYSYIGDIRDEINNSIYINGPNISILDKLTLEDNRIIDIYSGLYKTYNINIKSLSSIEEYFFKDKMVKFKMEGETL